MLARREAMYGDRATIRALEDHLWRWAGRSTPPATP